VPTLILSGTADAMVREADGKALAAAMRRNRKAAVLAPLQSVGHFLQRSPGRLEIFPDEWRIPSPVDRSVVNAITQWLTKR
jgi:hypothetical protein